MGKLVVLKIGHGNFERGFPVTLQIGEDQEPPSVELTSELPPNGEVPRAYARWQSIYGSLDLTGRPMGVPKKPQRVVTIADCEVAAQELRDRFNDWLGDPALRRLREKWLEQLTPSDPIRAIIQTDHPQLRRFPWHLWDLLERYPKAEVALSPLDFGKRHSHPTPTSPTVRILAILGNSTGIDIQKDRALLESVEDAQVTFLVEPQRQDLNDQLWEQQWDILFFAGHSRSQGADATGQIHLNQTEVLTIGQLKHGLEKAVERGLKLAIFNSCDGLGLARELAYLHIPQLIVMREPVPDRVAQEFLKYFLATYSQGETLYLAVREARKRLQGLEGQFPCATWLPVICQHPTDVPATWQTLKKPKQAEPQAQRDRPAPPNQWPHRLQRVRPQWSWVLAASAIATTAVMGARLMGWFQPWEIKAFDYLMQLRPKEPKDDRLLIIEITEQDVADQNRQDPQKPKTVSLSNRTLAALLEKLEPLKPRVIGLDIYRDYPIGREYSDLALKLKTSDRLITICKTGDPNSTAPGIAPPPDVPATAYLERLGFSNLSSDRDTAIRRQLLAMEPSVICPADYSLNIQLALNYLAGENIHLEFTPTGNWKLGTVIITPMGFPTGGYFKVDGRGHQILLNYRSPENASSFHTPEEIASRISLGKALAGGLTAANVTDKIVLIGTTAHSFNDYLPTPYLNEQGELKQIPGVMFHAQMTSQIISRVLNGRPLLWALPLWAEGVWIFGWALLGSLLVFYLHRFAILSLASGAAIALLYGLCLVLLVQFGCWLPSVPTAIACMGSLLTLAASSLRLTPSSSLPIVPQE